MKKIIFILILLISTPAWGSQFDFKNDANLQGYWTFNNDLHDTAIDESKNNNHGTVEGNPVYGGGKEGSAWTFDGTDTLQCGSDASIHLEDLGNAGAISISCWAYITNETDDRIMVSQQSAAAADGVTLCYDNGDDTFHFRIKDNNGWQYAKYSQANTSGSTWYHVVGVLTEDGANDTLTVYVNGVAGSTTDTSNVIDGMAGRNVLIGGRDASGRHMVGIVDEVMIFDDALTVDEINDIYDSQKGERNLFIDPLFIEGSDSYVDYTADADCYAAYRFNDTHDQFLDISGNDRHATNDGGATWTGSAKEAGGWTFDGNADDDRLQLGSGTEFEESPFSVVLWVKPNSPQDWARLISKFAAAGSRVWYIIKHSDERYYFGVFEDDNTEYSTYDNTVDTTLSNGTWYHLAATFDGQYLKFYIDAGLKKTKDIGSSITLKSVSVNTKLADDTNNGASNAPWAGDIDEVAYFSKELTAAEIKQIYLRGIR